MIQANELRIGNWVNTVAGDLQVTRIDGIRRRIECGSGNFAEIVLDPIPLTPEILEKAGFSRCTCKGWKVSKPKFHIDSKFVVEHKVKVKTVHQLQNLYFALTGTELNIQL